MNPEIEAALQKMGEELVNMPGDRRVTGYAFDRTEMQLSAEFDVYIKGNDLSGRHRVEFLYRRKDPQNPWVLVHIDGRRV